MTTTTFNAQTLLKIGVLHDTEEGVRVDCNKLFVCQAEFDKRPLALTKDKMLDVPLPTYIGCALEDKMDALDTLKVVVVPEHSKHLKLKAMAGLTPAHAPVPSPARHTPVVSQHGNRTITVTVCVSSNDGDCLSKLTPVPPTPMGKACCGDITINPADITDKGDGFYALQLKDGVLGFRFHRDIAEGARTFLEKGWDAADCAEGRRCIELKKQNGLVAMKRDSRPGANDGASCIEAEASTTVEMFSPFSGKAVADPLFDNGEKSSGDWVKDVKKLSPTTSASASPPPPVLPRDEVATAFDGALNNVLTKEALKHQKDLEKEARRLERLAKAERLAEAERQAAQAAQTREEAFRAKSIILELEAQKRMKREQEEKDRLDCLTEEFEGIQPFTRDFLKITLEQFLTDPEGCRAMIADLQESSVPVQEEAQEEDDSLSVQDGEFPQILAQTPRADVVKNLQALAKEYSLEVHVTVNKYAKGPMYIIDVSTLLAMGILTLRVSTRGNEIVVGKLTSDGKHEWGYCVNVVNGSYNAVVSMFPEMDDMIKDVMSMRDALKIQKPHQRRYQHQHLQQGLLPIPGLVCVLPVCDEWGRIVAYQQAPSYAYQQAPLYA
jgi:hypothetical protein